MSDRGKFHLSWMLLSVAFLAPLLTSPLWSFLGLVTTIFVACLAFGREGGQRMAFLGLLWWMITNLHRIGS